MMMNCMKKRLRRCSLLLTLLCVACSPSKQIAELSGEFREEYTKLPDYGTLPQKRISWAEALEKMQKGNLEYLQTQQEYTKARRQVSRVWREFIPMLDLGQYYNAPLKWGSGEPAQNNFNINFIFNIPGLVTLPVEHYTDALTAIKADTDCKLKRRELEARLYQCFCEYELMEREKALEDEKAGVGESQKWFKQEEFARKQRAQWSKLGQLLNDHSARWEPDTRDMPKVDIAAYRKCTEAPDELLLAVMALQYEASRLTKLGAALSFAPSVYVNFFSPSLFSSTAGEMGGFMGNGEDVRVSLNTYMRLDTKLDMYHDYMHAAAAHDLTRKQLSQQMVEHKEKLVLLMESWEEYRSWKESVGDYVAFRNRQGVSDAEEALRRHQESVEVEQNLIEQQRANLERECALLQEYGWK